MKAAKRYKADVVLKALIDFAESEAPTFPDLGRVISLVLYAETGFDNFRAVRDVMGIGALNELQFRDELRQCFRQALNGAGEQDFLRPTNVTIEPAIYRKKLLVSVTGPLLDVIWFQVIRLLQIFGPERLRLCECGRVFFKKGKRLFCSERCQKRVYMRGYRE